MFEKILVALDDSDMSQQVYERAMELAQISHARLMLLHVLSPIDDGFMDYPIGVDAFYPRMHEEAVRHHIERLSQLEEAGLMRLKDLSAEGSNRGLAIEFTQMMGDPGNRICALAHTWGADLIVMGRRGRKGLSEWLLGSVSNYVVHHANCSVLTVQHIATPLETTTPTGTPVGHTLVD